jgi:hypothetical protein
LALGGVLAVSVLGIVALSGSDAQETGIEPSPGLLVLLGGVWLVPLLLVGLGHGWTFTDRRQHGREDRDRSLRRT